MKKITNYTKNGEVVSQKLTNEEPICDKDFCVRCGDCLHCSQNNPCVYADTGNHFWLETVGMRK